MLYSCDTDATCEDDALAPSLCSARSIAIIDGGAGSETSDDFETWMHTNFPLTADRTVKFSSEEQFRKHVEDFAYGKEAAVGAAENPYAKQFMLAVAFTGAYPQWDFKIRVNYTDPNSLGEPRNQVPSTQASFSAAAKQDGSCDCPKGETNVENCDCYSYMSCPDPQGENGREYGRERRLKN
jgi:hypothetical protein